MGQFAVILPAAGRSTRFGDPKQKKIYAELEGRAVWLRALDPFLTHGEVEQIIVAIAPEDRELFDRRYRDQAAFLNLDVIDGGDRAVRYGRPGTRAGPAGLPVRGDPRRGPALPERGAGDGRLRRGPRARRGAAGRAGERHDQAGRRRSLHHRDDPSPRTSSWPRPRRSSAATGWSKPTPTAASAGPRSPTTRSSSRRWDIAAPSSRARSSISRSPPRTTCGSPRAILRAQSKDHRPASGHPFADEAAMWNDLPRLKPTDLFDS